MPTVQYYMNYIIFFQDDTEYQFALAVAGGNLLALSPRDAATIFNIPYPYPSGNMATIEKGINFIYPYSPGSEFKFPNSTGILVDDSILTTTIPGQAGSPASIWPAGPDGIFTWSGNIITNGQGAQTGPVPTAIPQRRWIGGRELPQSYEGGSSIAGNNQSRDFSRTIDGFGICIRGNDVASSWLRTVNEFRTGLVTRTSWERFYVRFRRVGSTDCGFWRCHGTPSNLAGCCLFFKTNGAVDAVDINSAGTGVNKGTIWTPTLNIWYRVDILLKYGSGSPPGAIVFYINGVLAFTYTDIVGHGMEGGTAHTNSELGYVFTGGAECEIDLDDWINADLPANCDATSLSFIDNNFPIDWLVGSHIRAHYTEVASQTGWTPAAMAKGVLNQIFTPNTRTTTSELNSVTSGATLEGLTDALTLAVMDSIAITLGVASAIIAIFSRNLTGTDGQLGYRKAGAAAVLATINQGAGDAANRVAYQPTGMITPDEVSPWSVTHTKSVDANSDFTSMLMSAVEYIGVWGPEDDPSFQYPISRLSNLHNCRYGNTTYGYLGSQPDAPVFAVGGTYVGNGTYQEITLPAPCHFLWIRPPAGSGSGCKLFGSGTSGNLGGTDRVIPNIRVWFDLTTQTYKFAVTGSATSALNVSGTTYQYVAFCDPGMRFNLCGAFNHATASSVPKSNPLIASDFIPIHGFFQREQIGVNSGSVGLFLRGISHTSNNIWATTGAQFANGANLALGTINSYAELHFGGGGGTVTNYSVWRILDSGADGCAGVMVQILTYVGNGVGSRVITLTPTSGRYPLMVMVFPTSATGSGFVRDPAHTGSNSSNIDDNVNSTTGITGVGIDQITVNSAINASGVTYSVFAICGNTTGMVNGSYYATYCEGDGPYINPLPPQGDINVYGNGGLILDGSPPLTLLKDISGIYTLVPDKTNDTLIDRQTGQASVDTKIPDPLFKTGYIGG